ncbi:MAG: hypothetical protein NTV46_12100 [Verrucomicrobia bacterium]|nr:hypothetical protein [Verrucomicrobiota bacterium]
MNTSTPHKKHHRLDPAEIVALAALSAVGTVLRNPRLANLDVPPAMRADVTFEGCAGSGQITGTEIFGPYDKPLEDHDAACLLEVSLPAINGDKMPIGKLLNGALLSLLEFRHPGWADDEGCEGRVELYWLPRPDGTTETRIGGTIGYRSLVTHTYEFLSANGELTPWECEG